MTSSHLSGSESETIRATFWKQILKWSIRLIVLLLVGWGILQTWHDAFEKFTSHQFRILDLRPLWLLASAAFYFLAMLPMAAFWHRVLWSMDQRPTWSETFSAHCTGQLGKYVPGKAMVVFLRATLIRSDRVDVVAAGIGVFVETLSVMAIGACVAAGILAFHAGHLAMVVLAVCLALLAGIPVFPPIMKRIIWFFRLKKLGLAADSLLARFTLKQLAPGWFGLVVSWWLIGLSLWAVIAAMPQGPTPIESIGDWPLLTACAALAMVAGFLSLLPAGILVREYVVMALLASHPDYGPLVAIVSAVVLRLTWLLTELITAAVCYGNLRFRRFPRQEG